jgi:hypothetical protein
MSTSHFPNQMRIRQTSHPANEAYHSQRMSSHPARGPQSYNPSNDHRYIGTNTPHVAAVRNQPLRGRR